MNSESETNVKPSINEHIQVSKRQNEMSLGKDLSQYKQNNSHEVSLPALSAPPLNNTTALAI